MIEEERRQLAEQQREEETKRAQAGTPKKMNKKVIKLLPKSKRPPPMLAIEDASPVQFFQMSNPYALFARKGTVRVPLGGDGSRSVRGPLLISKEVKVEISAQEEKEA